MDELTEVKEYEKLTPEEKKMVDEKVESYSKGFSNTDFMGISGDDIEKFMNKLPLVEMSKVNAYLDDVNKKYPYTTKKKDIPENKELNESKETNEDLKNEIKTLNNKFDTLIDLISKKL